MILIDLFNPDAKNPPKGPIILANNENTSIWACNFVIWIDMKGIVIYSSDGATQEGKAKGVNDG